MRKENIEVVFWCKFSIVHLQLFLVRSIQASLLCIMSSTTSRSQTFEQKYIIRLFLFCSSMQIILLCCVSRLLNGAEDHKITTYWKCSTRFCVSFLRFFWVRFILRFFGDTRFLLWTFESHKITTYWKCSARFCVSFLDFLRYQNFSKP